ncbi:flagellar hook-associated protein FlgL [Luminiphilus sp.]|nr:flagellar hook-associated protein FlgL [Luminiphilus sp.]
MTERISSSQFYLNSLNSILDAQTKLARTQTELASGKRILRPSDDPSASLKISEIQTELSKIETYQRNANSVSTELSLAEAAIASVENVVLRAKELAIRGNNAALSLSEKELISAEVMGLKEQLLSISGTKAPNGEYLFAGTRVDQPPYADINGSIEYQGDLLKRSVNLGPGVTIESRVIGNEVFGTNDNLFGVLDQLSTALTSAGGSQDLGQALDDLDQGLNTVLSARASVGLKINRVDDQLSLNETFNYTLQETLSGLEDLDYAEAITKLNLQMVALQAAQQTFTKTQGMSLFNYM